MEGQEGLPSGWSQPLGPKHMHKVQACSGTMLIYLYRVALSISIRLVLRERHPNPPTLSWVSHHSPGYHRCWAGSWGFPLPPTPPLAPICTLASSGVGAPGHMHLCQAVCDFIEGSDAIIISTGVSNHDTGILVSRYVVQWNPS